MSTQAATANMLPNLSAGFKPVMLLVGLAAAVAAGVGLVLWSQGPTYGLLYSNLADEDAAAITQSLSAAGIKYRMENGTGAISVPAEKINEARLLLAGQGVMQTGGFANLTKDGGLGVSQFMETARYQHAIEQELARTISSLQQVAAARVHIAVPRSTTFVRERSPGSASVFLQLKAGRRLSSEQVTAIVNLVASSLPDIDASQVTVVDQQGRLLSSPQGRDEFAARDQQIEFTRQFEESYSQRVEALIAPLVGAGRVRAEVSAQFDMSAVEEAREQFKPDSQVVRSEQVAEDRRGENGGASGVPGSLSNQPQGRAANSPAGGGAAANAQNGSTNSTRNYEIDRTIAYTRQPAGRLQRISVAVLVDNVQVTGKDGKTSEVPLTPDQINRITTLVKDAVGFNTERGDSVNVINSPWRGDPRVAAGQLESLPIWERAWARDAAKMLIGLIALLALVFAVLRPLAKQFAGTLAAVTPVRDFEPLALPGGDGGMAAVSEAMARAAGAASVANSAAASAAARTAYEDQIAHARALVGEDPARVALVVKKWVANDG
ncbi:MAG: flagellar basal-body MS-ring/collar protein FliF [Gammaproteobacteria bacterium]|jgi:flagellar M-ring protein FliF